MPSRNSDTSKSHPLDLHSMKELPDSHSWVTLEGSPASDSSEISDNLTIPVIDLDDPNVVTLLGHACKTWGVFQVKNHGISKNLLDRMEGFAQKLFDLPIQQKLKAARAPNCIAGYGVARISCFFSKLMWSEGFTIVGSPIQHARQLWPHDYIQFCNVVQEYEEEMKNLSGKLMQLMLGSLEISPEEVNWAGPNGDFKASTAALQLNSYPACPDPDRAMGLAPHTDSTLLTILHQNDTSGLQVKHEEIGWVMVDPLPGALVVNIGDMLHILSNGLYPSVLHRAVVNRTRHRLSVAYLYGPPTNVEISPLAKLVENGQSPLYRGVTWSEYLGTKAKLFNKALSAVRLCVSLDRFGDGSESQNSTVTVG